MPLIAVQLPIGILLLLACYAVVRRYLASESQPVDIVLGLLAGWAAIAVTSLLVAWLGLQQPPGPLYSTQSILLVLFEQVPYVGLNALLISWRAKPSDARDAGSAVGYGLALANLTLLGTAGANIHLLTLVEVLRSMPMLLLSILLPVAVSLALALARDRKRLALNLVAIVLLVALNSWADGTLLLTGAFVAYEISAIALAVAWFVLVVRAYRGTGNPPTPPISRPVRKSLFELSPVRWTV